MALVGVHRWQMKYDASIAFRQRGRDPKKRRPPCHPVRAMRRARTPARCEERLAALCWVYFYVVSGAVYKIFCFHRDVGLNNLHERLRLGGVAGTAGLDNTRVLGWVCACIFARTLRLRPKWVAGAVTCASAHVIPYVFLNSATESAAAAAG